MRNFFKATSNIIHVKPESVNPCSYVKFRKTRTSLPQHDCNVVVLVRTLLFGARTFQKHGSQAMSLLHVGTKWCEHENENGTCEWQKQKVLLHFLQDHLWESLWKFIPQKHVKRQDERVHGSQRFSSFKRTHSRDDFAEECEMHMESLNSH